MSEQRPSAAMDVDDQVERAWWVFRLPHEAVAFVPANTEKDARDLLADICYRDAPVNEWPCSCSRWATRAAIVRSARRT